MKKHKPLPTLEEVGKTIRRVDISRLENRLAGKPLVELEHCLIECLGYLADSQRIFNECIVRMAKDCIEAGSKDEFLSCYRDYKKEKSSYGSEYNLCSPVGEYFNALRGKLIEREEQQADKMATFDNNGVVSLTHARILVILVCQQIDLMWSSSQYTNEKVEKLWDHWMNANTYKAN